MHHLLWGKVVLLLVGVVAVLQVVHLVLLSRLESRHRRQPATGHAEPLLVAAGTQVESLFSSLALSLQQHGRVLDASGEYRLVPHLATTARRPVAADTTLVTQCSYGHLQLIPALVERWQGVVSVAVYAEYRDLSAALWAIASLRSCYSGIRQNVSFHLVSPMSSAGGRGREVAPQPPLVPPPPSGADPCSTAGMQVSGAYRANYAGGARYPNNLLRNVARRGAETEFVLVADIDMVPSANLRADFYEFALRGRLFSESRRDDKTVYVVPAFEAPEAIPPPEDKAQLLKLAEKGLLRPFYIELCLKCQVHTDYEAWQKEPPSKGLSPLFEVLWKDPWEPFYISRNSVPFYDERFKQYGFNRISQVCELHVAGYKFSVLNNGFLVHRGLKTANSFHTSKDIEQERNRMLFRQFKIELKDKYPESSRRCY
ncbi:beta-1,4-glucuronyltransferase 1-like [Schistocerca americana]|uniref:beta-1,4-glucuronyltransferase 1-like n=1 Tax=Schistocerca americana TaxID=7009 RepID=UPI001F5011E1|nr:beta-1,4-glucuronyltransferase 1-like [Schistocerca americana]